MSQLKDSQKRKEKKFFFFYAFFLLFRPSIGWMGLPRLGRAICFMSHTDSNVNLIREHSHTSWLCPFAPAGRGRKSSSVWPADTSPVEDAEGHPMVVSPSCPWWAQKSGYRVVHWHCKGEGQFSLWYLARVGLALSKVSLSY